MHHAMLAPCSQVRFICTLTGRPIGVWGRREIVTTLETINNQRPSYLKDFNQMARQELRITPNQLQVCGVDFL